MKSYFAGLVVTFGFLVTLSYASDTYRMMRTEASFDDTVRTSVIIRDMTQFACAMKVVETSAYHRGLVDGATNTGEECFKTSHESKKMSIKVRVEACEKPEEWLTTEYYCEQTPDKREKEPVE